MWHGLNTFLLLYWLHVLKVNQHAGSLTLTAYFALSALSTLLGGRFADKYGKKKLIVLCFFLLAPSLTLLSLIHSSITATLLLIPIAIGISAGYSSCVVLGQQYLQNHQGFASGITVGLAVSVGGIAAPCLGKIGDIFGLTYVIGVLAALSFLGGLLALWLSDKKDQS